MIKILCAVFGQTQGAVLLLDEEKEIFFSLIVAEKILNELHFFLF